VIVAPGPATDCAWLAAVVRGLATLPGLTWASSGNRLIATREEREAWLARASPRT
jgi:hypothetical protein